ncbi:restriction endonuclease [bacterium]|nr:MAG: restriction endonuclease [bacterium]
MARKPKLMISKSIEDFIKDLWTQSADTLHVTQVGDERGDWTVMDGQHRALRLNLLPGVGRQMSFQQLLKNLSASLEVVPHGSPQRLGNLDRPEIGLSLAIVPDNPVAEGVLVRSTSIVWATLVNELSEDWTRAYSIPWRTWEELLAGGFKKAGYDEVILTPRSRDHGRDVIATKFGVGSVRILGSMKAYKPGHLISKEEVHALAGVVAIDPNASKGIIATTSDFAPGVREDPRLIATVPYRIELLNGAALREWLIRLAEPPQ